MADANGHKVDRETYVNDPRIACKYGVKCYQKNAVHSQKYKHPPPKGVNHYQTATTPPRKRFKMDFSHDATGAAVPPDNKMDTTESNKHPELRNTDDTFTKEINTDLSSEQSNIGNEVSKVSELRRTEKNFNPKEFIKKKFLVEMPLDFYQFWDFCKSLNEKRPHEALKDVGLILVGSYDVLAGKFNHIVEQSDENYLLHWRYYYDPPECQTVLKGDDKTGYHICYYRDSPNDKPVFLVSNCAKIDGVLKVIGDNIFAAVYLFLEDIKKSCDPFKKIHIGRLQNAIKKRADELQLGLSQKSQKIRDRDQKIVTRSFSKIGIVVPYNRKTQLGYRDLGVTNKELLKLLDDIQNARPEQKQTFLSKLQDILTNVSIATDECDFGTGIELGLDILAHGVDGLNQTVSRFLATSYRLIGREGFAKIAEAHMKNRKKGTHLSIV